jgi:hypothetical protein
MMYLLLLLLVLTSGPECLAAKTSVLDAEAEAILSANAQGTAPKIDLSCRDRHRSCDDFVEAGNCDMNPGWMIMNCPVACGACHLRNQEIRCQRENMNMSTDPIYLPGDLRRMFESVIDRFEDRYTINVLSASPYILTIEDFLSNDEIRALIGTVKGWQRSTDSGEMNSLGQSGSKLSEGRTSSTSWCDGDCENNPHVTSVYKKIEEVVNIPRDNFESFQVLRYELGQRYEPHHDYGTGDKYSAAGPRILTFFLYLSDVDEGGETQFPAIGLSVKPKKGRAVLWPSVFDHDLHLRDARTMHEAQPIVSGKKFAANTWIHLYNYVEASKWGCAGGADFTDPSQVQEDQRDGFMF